MFNFFKKKPVTYTIAETSTSTWSYHIREVHGKLFLSGGAPPALCGSKLGWDIKTPVDSWGHTGFAPIKWCAKCEEIYRGLHE